MVPQGQHYSPPAAQRSAPVQPNNVLSTQQSALFSKTPRCQLPGQQVNHHKVTGQQQQQQQQQHLNVSKDGVNKPPQTPNTPPPPPVLTTSTSHSQIQRTPARTNTNGNVPSLNGTVCSSRSDVIAITPQSHHNGNINSNSASNHSTASNNTSATTVIESAASHSSHSSHSHHSPHSNINGTNVVNTTSGNKLVAPKGGITCVPKLPPPQLANPLPAVQQKKDIIIPLETQQYNALLTQMYGNQVPSINGYGPNFQQVTVQDNNQYNNGYVTRNNGYTQSTQGLLSVTRAWKYEDINALLIFTYLYYVYE